MAEPDFKEEDGWILAEPEPDVPGTGSEGVQIADPIPKDHQIGDAAREDVREGEGFSRDAFGQMGHTANIDKAVVRVMGQLGILDEQSVQDTLASMTADEEARREQSPVASRVGRIAGEVGLGLVGGAATRGGLAAAGAAQAGASEFGRTGDPVDTALGAAAGGATGAAAGGAMRGLAGLSKLPPPLPSAAQPVYSGVREAVKGQASRAARATGRALHGAGVETGRSLRAPIAGASRGAGPSGALAGQVAEMAGPDMAQAQPGADPQAQIGPMSRMDLPEARPGEVSRWEIPPTAPQGQIGPMSRMELPGAGPDEVSRWEIPPYEVELGEAEFRPDYDVVLGEAEIRDAPSPVDGEIAGQREALIQAFQSPALEAYPGLARELGDLLSGWTMGEEPDPSTVSLMEYKLSEVPGLDWAQIDPKRLDEA